MPTLTRALDSTMGNSGYMTVAEVAKICGVTRQTVNLWIQKKVIAAVKVGYRVYIERKSLLKYLGPDAARILAVG